MERMRTTSTMTTKMIREIRSKRDISLPFFLEIKRKGASGRRGRRPGPRGPPERAAPGGPRRGRCRAAGVTSLGRFLGGGGGIGLGRRRRGAAQLAQGGGVAGQDVIVRQLEAQLGTNLAQVLLL